MRKLLYITLTTSILFVSTSTGLEGEGLPGAFMRFGFGAREMSMGGAGTAICEGPLAIYWNPSLTSIDNRVSFESSMVKLSLDRYLYYALAGVNIGGGATISGGLISANTKHIEQRDTNGQKVGEFDYPRNSFCIAFTPAFSRYFNVGIVLRKHDYELFGVGASGISLDLGLNTHPIDSLRIGAYMGDVWSTLQWDALSQYTYGRDEKMPFNFRLGVGFYSFEDRLIISGEFRKVIGDDVSFHLGAEGWILPCLALRGGIDHDHLNYGAGFEYPLGESSNFYFDYAYIQDQFDIKDGHIVSLGVEL